MEPALWGLIGTIVGALASIGTTWLSSYHSGRLQDRRTREERIERGRAFQRQTLLELQEAVHDALRLIARAHIEDCDAYRKTNVWGKNSLTDEVNEGVRLANRRVTLLIERVSDDSLRVAIAASMKTATQVIQARSEAEAEAYLHRAMSETNQALEKLGVVLRLQYD